MVNKKIINSANAFFVLLATFSAILVLLVEPIKGVIQESALPFGIKSWNILQFLLILTNILGTLLVAYFITYKNEVVKYITIESTPELVNEKIQNLVDQEDFANLATQQKLIDEINSLKDKESNTVRRNEKILAALCNKYEFSQAVCYVKDGNKLNISVNFAFVVTEDTHNSIDFGEGISGQVAKTGNYVYLKEVPQGYMKVLSGLGEMSPTNLIIVPYLTEEGTVALAELASFKQYNDKEILEIVNSTKIVLQTILE